MFMAIWSSSVFLAAASSLPQNPASDDVFVSFPRLRPTSSKMAGQKNKLFSSWVPQLAPSILLYYSPQGSMCQKEDHARVSLGFTA